MTLGLETEFGGMHFQAVRILSIAGFVRVVVRGELKLIRWTKIDTVFVAWLIVSIITYTILWGTFKGLLYKSALSLDAVCVYFCFRAVVTELRDVERIFVYTSLIIIPLAAIMLYEFKAKHNIFYVFGGVPEIPDVRDGKMRCQGPFRHPILAGMFGATVMPFIIWQWCRENRNQLVLIISLAASAVITYVATSSGALIAVACEIIAFFIWKFRDRLRVIQWSIVLGLVGLSLVMKAPIWYLLARLSEFTGGGGYHRAYLLDIAFQHFSQWWLVGTTYTADWFPYQLEIDNNNSDITNHFLVQGITGGVFTMILFTVLVVLCFVSVGKSLRSLESASFRDRFLVWTLGVTLLGHVAAFISVSYFDQILVMWYMLQAMIVSVGVSIGSMPPPYLEMDDEPLAMEGTA
jgi:hypothetical protein